MGEIFQSVVLIGKKNKRIKAFLDSGASTTYIKNSLVDEMGYTRIRKEKVELGNGEKINGDLVWFGMIVRQKQKAGFAIAIDMPEELILGHDFFQDNDVILDYSKDKFRFSRRTPSVNRRLRL